MRPSEASALLRRIASGIDRAGSPSLSLVARDLRKVLSALRTAGTHLPNGEVIPVAPSSGSFQSPSTGLNVDYKLDNVGHMGEKGYEDLRGSVSIDGGPWFTMDAEAYKSLGRYKSLTCSDPSVNPAAYNDQLVDRTGVDLGGLLAEAVSEEILGHIDQNGIVYNEGEGPYMDLRIDDNQAFDDTDADDGQEEAGGVE